MDEQNIQEIAKQLGPQVINQAVSRVMSEIDPNEISAEDLAPILAALEETLHDPRVYPQAVRAMYEAGIAEPGSLPEQFDPTFVVLMVIVLTKVVEALQQRQSAIPANFKHGGLTTVARALQAQGRHGDTMLAHINPQEAAMLKRMGGSGTINPHTGLPEFGFFKSIVKAVTNTVKSVVNVVKDTAKALGPIAPIIAAVAAPWAIPALASTLGVGSLMAGALYGAGTSALTGGNVLQGAVMGGLGGGLGSTVGSSISDALKLGLSPSAAALAGNTLIGGALGAATGQGFGKGAIGAATGTMLGNAVGNLAGQGAGTAFGQGLRQAGQTIGHMTTAGMPLKQAIIGGALSGLTKGALAASASPLDRAGAVGQDIDSQIDRVNKLLADPSVPEAAKQAYSDYLNQLVGGKESLSNMQQTLAQGDKGTQAYQQTADLMTKGGTGLGAGSQGVYQELGIAPPSSASIGATNVGMNLPTAMVAASAALPFALDSLAKAQTPQEIQQAIQNASSKNPEYFNNLRLNSWDWDAIQQQANAANVPLGLYVAQNWNDLTNSVRYTSPGGTTPTDTTPTINAQPSGLSAVGSQGTLTPNLARGGALSKVAYLAQGSGNGRADTIDARLSDGEYVIDAETVALLGDGSTKAGASRLDEMRAKIRQHKGKALSRGKFSPNAKSPLTYLKGAM